MATRAESLIRQFCHQRRLEVDDEHKAANKRVPQRIAIRSLPAGLRAVIAEFRRVHARERQLEQRLKAAGIGTYELALRRTTIGNPKAGELHMANNSRAANRRRQIEAIQQKAYVDVLGKPPAEARAVVERVQRELKQV
jgi:hypothetical protein